ncbi:MAG: VWA domain-containing protein [Pseudomonadota bacterium]
MTQDPTEDAITRALREAPPPAPGAATRSRDIAAAMAAFDTAQKEKSEVHQGIEDQPRPRTRQSRLTGFWRRTMDTLPSTHTMMLGGTSFAALTLAIVVGANLMQHDPMVVQPDPAAVSSDSDAEVTVRERRGAAPVSTTSDQEITAAPTPLPLGQGTEQLKRQAAPMAETQLAPSQPAPAADVPHPTYQEQGRDRFEAIETNPVKLTTEDPVSTFSIDVDTASYAFVRRQIMAGVLPQKDAVRVEEMINYFPYDYAPPADAGTPFATHVSVFDTPWNENTRLMRVAIKGYELQPDTRPSTNLVFLLDTSGSMGAPDKLPLLINSFRLLIDSLSPTDTVSIVVYAGSAGTVLEPTSVAEKGKIFDALGRLRAGGSTAGGEGIRQAYALAERNFDPDGVNRIILATDGDFNVGISSVDELQGFVERKRETGVYLSVLGFGQGNLNDKLMQTLAQNGNGQAAYIDTLSEARKVLVEEAQSALFPIAEDVKIQVEFNPAAVAEYRLIGYETRMLARQDFNNDKVDAGEIGAGHTVTALYEFVPTGGDTLVDPLRYGEQARSLGDPDELAFLRLRYKNPGEDESQLIERPITEADLGEPDTEARFAAAVAGFGQLLRGGTYTGEWGYDALIELAQGAKGADPFGYRAEFVMLARLAQTASALPRQ